METSSNHEYAQDGYLKRPHPTIIGGDMRSDSGWFLGGFGVVRHLGTRFARRKLGKKKTHPDHGGCRRPTAAMVPHSQRRDIRQSANMLRDKSMSLKLENIFVITIY